MEKTRYKAPHLITFPRLGEPSIGYISVGETQKDIPFEIKRAFWTYFTPESIVRGRHTHYVLEQVLIAVSGKIIVNTEDQNGRHDMFVLDRPDMGLYVPPLCWHTMQYTHNAVQLSMASHPFNVADYIREYDEFKKLMSHE